MAIFFSSKSLLVLFLAGWIGVLLFGAWSKMRDGEAAWGRHTYAISRRNSKNPGGFWLSVGFNFVAAAACAALLIAILTGHVQIT
jgi:hypothetical protein